MIGTGLKKLANENGMKVADGLAYGTFRGYSAAFWDGSGTKTLMLSTSLPDVNAKSEFFSRLGQVNYKKEYRVRELTQMDNGIAVVFNDTVGTLKKMNEFFDFFFPILDACGATKADVCSCCGQPFDGTESWLLINDIPALMHSACRESIESDVRREEAAEKENDTGTYGAGFLGALLGAVAGAIVWALIYMLGRVSVVGGLIIALFAVKGYDILHGRQGKGKIAIVLIMSLLGVVLGTFGGEMIALIKEIAAGTLPGFVYGDAPVMVLTLFINEPEYQSIVLRNLGVGVLLAAVGIYFILQKTHRNLKGQTIKELP